MAIVVTMGRGGTGKTSLVALMAKYLIEIESTPLLLIDTDPDQNLAEMVGVDLEAAGKTSISELICSTFLEQGGTIVGVPLSERIEGKIWAEGLYEGLYFDLMAIGTKWTEGCYCLPNAALKGAMKGIVKVYRHILIDSPAGLEQLNRRVLTKVDDIFDVVDPSQKSFLHVTRAYKIIKEVGIEFKNFFLVGGYRFPEELGEEMSKRTGMPFLGSIPFDEQVARYVLEGRALLDISASSPAYVATKRIMRRAGYL
ncbi:MAG: AAA family ATPase [Candidatus Bathyarchaeia archaeon]